MFAVTRARKPGRTYKTSNESTTSKIVEIKEIKTQQGVNDQSIDAFSAVMGPEHPGCVGLYGVVVTKTFLKRINGTSEPTLKATNDVVQQMQERMQKMKDQIKKQKRTIREVIADVIAQFQNA
ncbi:hypothetical protein P3S67_012180 [Capsicum chacoense]